MILLGKMMILLGNMMILLWDNGDLTMGRRWFDYGTTVILLGNMVILLWENGDVTIFMAVMAPTQQISMGWSG